MDFDREAVLSGDEVGGIDGEGADLVGFDRGVVDGEGGGGDGAGGHVEAVDFLAV